MEPMDEEKVIEMCKRGDLSAYRALYDTYFFRILMNACFDVLRKRKGAEFKDLEIEKLPF